MKKQSIAIIGVIAFVLAVAVGYALFSQQIEVNGTATASGTFNVKIVEVGDPTCNGINGACSVANVLKTPTTIPATGVNEVTLGVTLDFPGAYAKIPVTVKNLGTIDAVLESISVDEVADENNILTINFKESDCTKTINAADGALTAKTGSKNYCVVVNWDSTDGNGLERDAAKTTSITKDFTFKLNYKQITTR